ncbi:MAG: hypothetical protein M3Q58_14390 [Bacteroidota bacterium]|nr:hypothetical protein [Bacteroidota bacterium]
MPGRNYNSTDYRYGFQGQEKDDEIKGSGNSYDFGARMYDPRIGRMKSQDRYNWVYPFYSPYNGMGNNPINNIDHEGNLIIFINGYWGGKSNSVKCHLELSRYWNTNLLANAAATLHDNSAAYFNASEPVGSTARARFNKGQSLGAVHAMYFKKLLDEQRQTDPAAVLNFVSHSMGGAYSAGLTNALSNAVYPTGHPNEGENIFNPEDFGSSFFLAPFQSTDFSAPSATKNYQFSHTNDAIASFGKIKGIGSNGGFYEAKQHKLNYMSDVFTPHTNATFSNVFSKKGNQLPSNKGGSGGDGHNHDKSPAPVPETAPRDNTRTPQPRLE